MSGPFYIMPSGKFPFQDGSPVLITRDQFELCCCAEELTKTADLKYRVVGEKTVTREEGGMYNYDDDLHLVYPDSKDAMYAQDFGSGVQSWTGTEFRVWEFVNIYRIKSEQRSGIRHVVLSPAEQGLYVGKKLRYVKLTINHWDIDRDEFRGGRIGIFSTAHDELTGEDAVDLDFVELQPYIEVTELGEMYAELSDGGITIAKNIWFCYYLTDWVPPPGEPDEDGEAWAEENFGMESSVTLGIL